MARCKPEKVLRMSEAQRAPVVWMCPDMRGHPSCGEMEREMIAAFTAQVGGVPEVTYGSRDGLYGLILEGRGGWHG